MEWTKSNSTLNTKTILAFLIDPFTQIIKAIPIENWNVAELDDSMCRIIGCDIIERGMIPDTHDWVWVDGNGLYKINQMFFRIEGIQGPLAGRGIVMNRYQTRPPKISWEQLQKRVKFLTRNVDFLRTRTNRFGELDDYLGRYSDSLEVPSEVLFSAESVLSMVRHGLESSYRRGGAVLTGSFGNRTEVASHSDVDYLLAPKGVKRSMDSKQVLTDFAEIITREFPQSQVFIDEPAVVLRYSGQFSVNVDIIPAVTAGDRPEVEYYIPDGSGGWMRTVADRHKAYVRNADAYLSYSVSRIVRLLKAWKYHRAPEIRSLYLELRAAQYAHEILAKHKERINQTQVPKASPEQIRAYAEEMVNSMIPDEELRKQMLDEEGGFWEKLYEKSYKEELEQQTAPFISLAEHLLYLFAWMFELNLKPMDDPLNIVSPIYGVMDDDKTGALANLEEAVETLKNAILAWNSGDTITPFILVTQLMGIDELGRF